ncbi:unnamed protein product [Moneuplotes crassus]|uniref:Uncharacterized protein n=1 Tax=Euplotes crassus TaxID=5936 RepID=A0AAD2D1Z8_EUPCR|nr:unnamed protein product [Moneuplotes crassus]
MHKKSPLGGIDEESSWEDSSMVRDNASKARVSPVSFLILIFNLVIPMGTYLVGFTYSPYLYFGFIGLTLFCLLIYPVVMLLTFRQMDGVWSRMKAAPIMEGNHGKIASFASFFVCIIFVPLWGVVPSLRDIKPEGDKLGVQELSMFLVIRAGLCSFYFMFILPILNVFYWNLYVYECFGYSIRLGIIKWLISLCFGFCAYFIFDFIDGPVVGLIAVGFFSIYCRISLWMRKKFGYLCSIICNVGMNIGIIIVVMIRLNNFLVNI